MPKKKASKPIEVAKKPLVSTTGDITVKTLRAEKVEIIPPDPVPSSDIEIKPREAPKMPKDPWHDRGAFNRPLIKSRTFLTIASGVLALLVSHFLGVSNFSLLEAADGDHILTVGEAIFYIVSAGATYYTKNRKGPIKGIVSTG